MGAYLRDLMTETTARSYEKDPTSGLFRCEPGFTGSDCTQLKCPYSMSFATSNIKQDWLYAPSTASLTTTKWGPTADGKQSQCQKTQPSTTNTYTKSVVDVVCV